MQPLVKTEWKVPQETKNRITIWPSNSTPGHASRQNYNSRIHAPLCSQQHYSQQPRQEHNLNIHWQVDKDQVCVCVYICTHTCTHRMEYSSAIKKSDMPLAATWMDPEIILSKVRRTNTTWRHFSVGSNTIQMNLSLKQKQYHGQRRDWWLSSTRGGGWERVGAGVSD